MIFRRIGCFVIRYRIPIILVWTALAVIITLLAPNIDDVASSDTADFLPGDAPFRYADNVYERVFPERFSPGSTVVVIDARQADGIHSDDVWRFIGDLESWLNSETLNNVDTVTAPTTSETAADFTVADNDQVAIVSIGLTTSSADESTIDTLTAIDDWLSEHQPDRVKSYQTGSAPIVTGTTEAATTSADRTIWVTVALVIVMLLLVYRSPVSPFIPLVAVTLAYLISRGIVAYLGDTVMTITSYTNILMVAVMYGAGTDYCLFLISRFREEMADDTGLNEATTHTVSMVGETISSSAGTIFVGFMAMSFAEMGIFNTSGPALAIGIVIGLLAGLTLTPALLATLGHRAFWPGQATHRSPGRLYELTSKQVSTYPLVTILVIVAIMIPFSIHGLQQRVSYDMLGDLPDDKPVVVGYEIMDEYMDGGNLFPLVAIMVDRDPDSLSTEMAHLEQELAALDNVADVRSLNSPYGQHGDRLTNLLRADVQLEMALQMLNDPAQGDSLDLQSVTAMINGVQSYLDTLAARFPDLADDEHLLTLQELLAGNPAVLLGNRDALVEAAAGLADSLKNIEDAYLPPAEISDLFGTLSPEFSPLFQTYMADDGVSYRLEIVLTDSPTSYRSMDTVHEIRSILSHYKGSGDAVLSGQGTVVTDIRDTMDTDLLRAIGFVLCGIFIVLLLMLRSVVAPMYLIGTVLLSFTCTLGITSLVFDLLFDVERITWWVPFFMFVFLVALGIDYSIFLFGRVKEEVGYHGIREGVHVAVAATGAIITSAGIILAGTFAALMSGEIMGLIEIGFAVSIGVLIDTFVVRTILDPALATLFGRWTWWPGGVPKTRPTARALEGLAVPPDGD